MKSAIRIKIETILNKKANLCYIDKNVKGYRMKLVLPNILTPKLVKRISALPHVIKVNYRCAKNVYRGWSSGVCIHFDCKPSSIKL
jgi:hypothetical protein